ncbi:MAG: FecR family protein [Pseudomonadota bacterium]
MYKNPCSQVLTLVMMIGLSLWAIHSAQAEDFPPGFTVGDTHKAGLGAPVAKVIASSGRSAVYHREETIVYWLQKEIPLFKGDTIVTFGNSGIELGFVDASRLSMGPDARLVITSALYDEQARERSSFLDLIQGKARFWVKKLIQFRRSEFRVKTNTSIAGVRGSDFITLAAPDMTQVTSFEDTVIEVVSLADPQKPVVLNAFETLMNKLGELPSQPEPIDLKAAAAMKNELPFSADPPLGTPVTFSGPGKENAILIPEEQLVLPDGADAPDLDPAARAMGQQNLGTITDGNKQMMETRFEEKLDNKHWDDAGFPSPPK